MDHCSKELQMCIFQVFSDSHDNPRAQFASAQALTILVAVCWCGNILTASSPVAPIGHAQEDGPKYLVRANGPAIKTTGRK